MCSTWRRGHVGVVPCASQSEKTEWEARVRTRIETWILEAFPQSDLRKLPLSPTHLASACQRAEDLRKGSILEGAARVSHAATACDILSCLAATVTLDPAFHMEPAREPMPTREGGRGGGAGRHSHALSSENISELVAQIEAI